MGSETLPDYVRNVCREKLIRGERLTGSDIWACNFNGIDVDALEREVNNQLKENAANG